MTALGERSDGPLCWNHQRAEQESVLPYDKEQEATTVTGLSHGFD